MRKDTDMTLSALQSGIEIEAPVWLLDQRKRKEASSVLAQARTCGLFHTPAKGETAPPEWESMILRETLAVVLGLRPAWRAWIGGQGQASQQAVTLLRTLAQQEGDRFLLLDARYGRKAGGGAGEQLRIVFGDRESMLRALRRTSSYLPVARMSQLIAESIELERVLRDNKASEDRGDPLPGILLGHAPVDALAQAALQAGIGGSRCARSEIVDAHAGILWACYDDENCTSWVARYRKGYSDIAEMIATFRTTLAQ